MTDAGDMQRLLFLWVWIGVSPATAKVVPPNYDFSLDSLAGFFPGQAVSALAAKHGQPEKLGDEGGSLTLRYQVAMPMYKFPVVVQAQGDKILDMHATLPSYFLHDVFLQSLVNRWGKQQKYVRVDEEAFYQWKDAEKEVSYGASCTITCFPVYLSVAPAADKAPSGFKPWRERLRVKTAPRR